MSVVIPGIRTVQHVTDNTAGLFQLDEEDRKLIENLGETDFVPLMDLLRASG